MIFTKLRKLADPNSEMSFLGHLEALRWHLFRSVIVVIITSVVMFFMKEFLFDDIILAPKNATFLTYRALCHMSHVLGLGQELCINVIPFDLINIDLTGQFTIHMWVAFVAGVIIAAPYILWEIWSFIKPALHEKERKSANGIIFYLSFLFTFGVLFGYYVIVPMSVNFLGAYQVSAEVRNAINLDSYISTVTTLTLISGIIFELPMVIFFLSKIGLITPVFMRNYRRHAVIVILILAAVLTPTSDITTLLLVAVPLYILYEISIFVSGNVVKNRVN
jgi:sec-independent protein translocase protein TatC